MGHGEPILAPESYSHRGDYHGERGPMNYVPHLAAGDVWAFLLAMIVLIAVTCLYQINSERKNETTRTKRRTFNGVRHNDTHDL